jgi:hypothetical protein
MLKYKCYICHKDMEESLPDVAELQDQFAAQQSMIEQMRDTLLQREQTNTSNEKKAQVCENQNSAS